MASTEVLGTYLNDHLSGANAGVEMAQRLHKRAAGGPDAAVLAGLAEDIKQDREELRRLVEQLGEAGHRVKKAGGWVAGKAHRLAVGELLTGDEHLSMLLETETLALGIEGKLALWEALLAVASAYPQLAESDLSRLAVRGTRATRPDRDGPPRRRPPVLHLPLLSTRASAGNHETMQPLTSGAGCEQCHHGDDRSVDDRGVGEAAPAAATPLPPRQRRSSLR